MFQLDAVARDRVLTSLKQTVTNVAVLARELGDMAKGGDVTLAAFLEETGREVEDVYRAGGWTTLRGRAKVGEAVDKEATDVSASLKRLLHTDDPSRLELWRRSGASSANDPTYLRRLTMLEFPVEPSRGAARSRGRGGLALRSDSDPRGALAARPTCSRSALAWRRRTTLWRSGRSLSIGTTSGARSSRAVGFVKPGKKGVTPTGRDPDAAR